MFDDAFVASDEDENEMVVNRYVRQLVEVINDAASIVHKTHLKLRPPSKIPTLYGGRLIWTLPGKNKLIVHLKDKALIRHRKRWSQVCIYIYRMALNCNYISIFSSKHLPLFTLSQLTSI